jgi:hypothetical protein
LPRDGEGWWRSGDVPLPLEAVLLLGLPDAEWGARLVALVRPGPEADAAALIRALEAITARWWPGGAPPPLAALSIPGRHRRGQVGAGPLAALAPGGDQGRPLSWRPRLGRGIEVTATHMALRFRQDT